MGKSLNEMIITYGTGKLMTDGHSYTGRGDPDDLSVDILEGMYKGIKKECGPAAATGYVKMLDENKKDMNVTLYLSALQSMAFCDWNYISQDQEEVLKKEPEKAENLIGVNHATIVQRAKRVDGVKPYPEGEFGSSYETTLKFLKNHQDDVHAKRDPFLQLTS